MAPGEFHSGFVLFLKNPYFMFFAGLYSLAFGILAVTGVYSLAEPLFMLFIFGLLLPWLAYALSKRCRPLDVCVEPRPGEAWLIFALVAFITLYLVWGSDVVDALVYGIVDRTESTHFLVTIGKKVLVFVLIPFFLLSSMYGYQWRDFGFTGELSAAFSRPYLLLMAVLFLVYLTIQFVAGQAAQPVFQGQFSVLAIVVGGLLLYLTQIIEVGLVEEFFFRAVLQTRLAKWLESEVAGVLMGALIFGLAHTPGLYLRGAGAVTSLGDAPGIASAMAYSVAVLALAGLAFGVIWAKTRNIYVLILVHAWVDTIAGLPDFIEVAGLN